MKKSAQVIAALNRLLEGEYGARNQYVAQEQWALDNGYKGLAAWIKARRQQEEEHIEEYQARILLLGGVPVADKIGPFKTGVSAAAAPEVVKALLEESFASENTAVDDGIIAAKLCLDQQDYVSYELVVHIDGEEQAHANDVDAYRKQLRDMGAPAFLGAQIEA